MLTIENNILKAVTDPTVTELTIPEGVTAIGWMALWGCANLKTLRIPASCTDVGEIPETVARVEIAPDHPTLFSDEYGVYARRDDPDVEIVRLNRCSRRVALPEGVTYIGERDLEWLRDCLEELILPESLCLICRRALYGFKKLRRVTFGKGLQQIHEEAFEGCESLETLLLPDRLIVIHPYAFARCPALKKVRFGKQLRGFSLSAFQGCPNASFEAPDNESFTNDNGVIYIGGMLLATPKHIRTLTVREGTRSIAAEACKNRESLESVTLPDTLLGIGERAFEGCTSLKNLDLGQGIKFIDGYALKGCERLTSLTLPPTMESIGEGAFYGCKRLTDLTLPAGIRMGENALPRHGNFHFT